LLQVFLLALPFVSPALLFDNVFLSQDTSTSLKEYTRKRDFKKRLSPSLDLQRIAARF
jgi:hypothetical protein